MTPDKIRAARLQLGLSQAEFAHMLGYGGQPRIAEIESGKRTPSETVVRLIQAYLRGDRPDDWPE